MADLDSKYRPALADQLEAGEELRGLCVASQQKSMFKGGAVAIGVTDLRLLIQPLDHVAIPTAQRNRSLPTRSPPRRPAEPAGAGGA